MHRIIFVIAVFLFSLSSVMGQMIPINLPADGNWPTIVGDSIMIIGPRQNELTEEQRYFNPVYLMTYPGKEHLKAQMIRAGACDCDLTKPNRRIGVFSVAPNKQVSFSQGNLQYLPAINLWKFANTQYEYLGNANKYLKSTFRNWVDLFGWSANNTTAPFGVSTSTNVADYAGDFVDWGTNTICGDAPNTWRTLSIEEWKYLYHERKNAEKLFALGTINGIVGLILLPDDWQLPEGATCQLPTEKGLLWDDNYNGGGYINTNTQANHYQDNIYTLEQWQVMEEAGAVFLPAAGYRENTNFSTQSVNPPSDYVGSYATSTIADKNNYYFMRFIHREVRKYSHSLYRGRAVRLVHDTIVPEVIPDPCMVVKVNDTLSINMMCVEGGTFMMGAMEGDTQANANEKPAHQVTLSDYYMSDVQVSQALWEYVMGTTIDEEVNRHGGDKNIGKGSNYPMYCIDWFQANEFAAKLSQMTGLLFSLPTEAEWEYAARGGQLSRGYKFAGSNNLDEVAWWGDPKGLVHPSAQKKPNELGIYDMCGNICEWTLDGYSNYTTEAQTNPCVPRVDSVVQRSMSSHNAWKESDHRTTFRYKKGPNHAKTRVGFRLVLHDTVPEPPKRIGVFSVAADKQVSFSQGNLQYTQSTDTWQFAKEQYEYIGAENIKDGALADRIDLFGWSASGNNAPFGVSTSTNAADYAGEFVDWGINTISGDAPGTWRTLSIAEWEYLLNGRENADNCEQKVV
ncbi:MAG: SUMF1/EgtB/PvdO family nonheme iron enzyme [Paludibacteraceae bacterium]|nr:SUMF1/EgtB/PvdO family nonheme iron enzyme [Paludibacteraceae bacterium]